MTVSREALRTALAEYVQTAGTSTNGRSALAEIIVESVEPNHLSLAIFSQFLPVVSLKPGDSVMRKVRRGRYPVRQLVPGTSHLTDTVYSADKVAYMFDALIAGTSHNLWELQSGDLDSVEKMRSDLQADVIDNIVSKIFTVLSTSWNATDTPTNYIDASSTGVTQTVLDTMIETILDTSGRVRAITGSRRALLPIYDFSGYKGVVVETGVSGTAIPLPQLEEFYRTNRVTSYKGIPLIEVDQVYKEDLPDVKAKMIPTDKVLVIGENAGSVALMGGFEYQDYTDMRTQPPNYVLHGWQQYAVLIDQITKLGVIKSNT
jgi:hypothetical protein